MARNRYLAALRKWDWATIKAEATENLEPDDDPGRQVGRSYLGSCFSLAPSRKYYAPFANRNLAPCPRCKGTGRSKGNDCSWCGGIGSREAFLDQEWYEALDKVADEHGMYIESGEGDPCDLFAVVSVEADEEGDEDSDAEKEGPPHVPEEPCEPWQMLRKAYIDLLLDGKVAPPTGVVVAGAQSIGCHADPHYTEVARAVAAGKPVPAEVLAEYPRIEQEVGQMRQAV